MTRLMLLAALLATTALADEDATVAYCKARGDIQQCKTEMLRGLTKLQEGLAWVDSQELVGPWEDGAKAIDYCRSRYNPNMLAVGACIDGFLFDRR